MNYQQLKQELERQGIKWEEVLPLYYATQQDIEHGTVHLSQETKFTPGFIVCHPDDLAEIKAGLDRPLRSVFDWRPTIPMDTGTTTQDILNEFERALLEEMW